MLARVRTQRQRAHRRRQPTVREGEGVRDGLRTRKRSSERMAMAFRKRTEAQMRLLEARGRSAGRPCQRQPALAATRAGTAVPEVSEASNHVFKTRRTASEVVARV